MFSIRCFCTSTAGGDEPNIDDWKRWFRNFFGDGEIWRLYFQRSEFLWPEKRLAIVHHLLRTQTSRQTTKTDTHKNRLICKSTRGLFYTLTEAKCVLMRFVSLPIARNDSTSKQIANYIIVMAEFPRMCRWPLFTQSSSRDRVGVLWAAFGVDASTGCISSTGC